MVVDFILDLAFGVAHWLVGLLPGKELVPEQLSAGVYAFGAEMKHWWNFANYFVPLEEFFRLVPLILLAIAVMAGLRFLIRLIPGVG